MKTDRLGIPEGLDLTVGEAMFTQRAIRRLDPDREISDENIKLILDAGSKAPNGGNEQPARFLVIRNRETIKEFGKIYYEAWWAKRKDAYGWEPGHEIPEGSPYRMASLLASEMVNAPLVILAFSNTATFPGSVFPAVQNILLSARTLGIGSVLTTLHPTVMDRVYEMFNIPAEAEFHCCIPMGYPRGNFGPTTRYVTSETTYWDSWGAKPPWD